MQAERQPTYPLLYSLPGFQYCDLLLTEAELAAWQRMLESPSFSRAGSVSARSSREPSATAQMRPAGDFRQEVRFGDSAGACARDACTRQLLSCRAVSERAAQVLKWEGRMRGAPILDFALHHLTLGRAALFAAMLEGTTGGPEPAAEPPSVAQRHESTASHLDIAWAELDAAVADLRRAGDLDVLPDGLLTRAWLRSLTGPRTGPESAQRDLDEAWEIAERGPMPLFLADIHLHRARLFGPPNDDGHPAKYPWTSPQADLAEARRLIEKHGYLRRMPELEDTESAASRW